MKLSNQFHKNIKEIVQRKDGKLLVKICGNSMIDANINSGDNVLVEESKEFVSGDIVLAYNGEKNAVIARFMSTDKPPYVYLKLENSNYLNILFTDSITMKGKVTSVIKNGRWKIIK